MFAHGEMKTVTYTRADVEQAADRRYRPGVEVVAWLLLRLCDLGFSPQAAMERLSVFMPTYRAT